MGLFNRTLGFYVKYSRKTARVNPTMVESEYKRLISEIKVQINQIEIKRDETTIDLTLIDFVPIVSEFLVKNDDNSHVLSLGHPAKFKVQIKNIVIGKKEERGTSGTYRQNLYGWEALRHIEKFASYIEHELFILRERLINVETEYQKFKEYYLI